MREIKSALNCGIQYDMQCSLSDAYLTIVFSHLLKCMRTVSIMHTICILQDEHYGDMLFRTYIQKDLRDVKNELLLHVEVEGQVEPTV